VVFPIVVESLPATELTLEVDVMTPHMYMYVMADVTGELVDANVTLPSTWNKMLMRGYGSAWTAMSQVIAFYSELPSTWATIPITMSRAFVDHRRVWGWFGLQSVALQVAPHF
jgi:hypothetical protein